MKQVTTTYGQTLIDIALQVYGCYEGVFLLMQDNGLSITDALVAGQVLVVQDVVPELNDSNLQIGAYFNQNKVRVNSGWITTDVVEPIVYQLNFEEAYNSQYIPLMF